MTLPVIGGGGGRGISSTLLMLWISALLFWVVALVLLLLFIEDHKLGLLLVVDDVSDYYSHVKAKLRVNHSNNKA